MERELFKDKTPAERLQALESNCDKVENASWMKSFSHDEITEFKEELSEVSIKLNDIAIEKKATNAHFTTQAKLPSERRSELLRFIKEKAVPVDGECFVFLNHEDSTAYYFNGEGDQVYSRPLLPKEKQKTVFHALRATGTDQ